MGTEYFQKIKNNQKLKVKSKNNLDFFDPISTLLLNLAQFSRVGKEIEK